MRKWIKGLVAGLLLLVCLPFAALEGLYRYGLLQVRLPSRPAVTLGEREQRALWIAEDLEPFTVEPNYAWDELYRLARAFTGLPLRSLSRPGEQAAYLTSRTWAFRTNTSRRGRLHWHFFNWTVSTWLTRHFSAAELTQLMSDQAWFGRGAVGLAEAARRYFGKRVEELSPHELAFLVGLLQAPSYYGPAHPERAFARRNFLLRQFAEQGLISREEAAVEMDAPLGILPRE